MFYNIYHDDKKLEMHTSISGTGVAAIFNGKFDNISKSYNMK